MREHMKSILYSALVGSLALALATGGAQAARDNNKRSQKAQPQQRTAKVQAARFANTGMGMAAHRNVSAAQNRQRSYANVKPRTGSTANRAPQQASGTRAKAARPASTTPATIRERNLARNERMRERNAQRNQEFRTRRDVAANQAKRPGSTTPATAATVRNKNVAARRPTSAPPATADVNRFRDT